MAETREIVEDENKIGTVIADDIRFKGTISFKDSLKIKGTFEGKIKSEGTLIVGHSATVQADINTTAASICGTVHGKIRATEKIEMFKSGTLSGDLITPDLYIEQGARLNGNCNMADPKKDSSGKGDS